MFARNSRHLAAASLLCFVSLLAAPAGATVTIGGDTGEVTPTNQNIWSYSYITVGIDSGKTGTLAVGGASYVTFWGGVVGQEAGSVGTVTVTDPGTVLCCSKWTFCLHGSGTLVVQNGAKVTSSGTFPPPQTYLGGSSGSTGIATVTGAGSTWTNDLFHIGGDGPGALTVSAGGHVITNNFAYLGSRGGAASTVTVTGANSTWTCPGLFAGSGTGSTLTVSSGGKVTLGTLYDVSLADLKGDGTIIAKGLVSDMDVVFDATHGANQAFSFGAGGTLNLNLDGTGTLGAGYSGTGTLRIADGVKVTSSDGPAYLGFGAGSTGTAIVAGAGSTWTHNGILEVGGSGTGSLAVEGGGNVTSTLSYIGYGTGSSGTAVVIGTGSTWTNNYGLYVGNAGAGTGTLTTGHGGKVTAQSLSISGASSLNLQVSGDSMLVLGDSTTTGSIANSGKVNLYADAFLAAKAYSPITESQGRTIAWTGTGSCNGYGGIWNGTTFTVAAATTSDSAASNTLTTGERLLIIDSGTGKRVGASFGTVAAGTNFSAAVLGGADLIGLPADQSVLGAWNFSTNFSGDQALLSFDIGAGRSGTLSVWHYDGSTWAPFAAPDLTYGDDGIANFAVTGFSGYAVTVAVPEPCSLALVALGGLALIRRRAA